LVFGGWVEGLRAGWLLGVRAWVWPWACIAQDPEDTHA